MLTSTPLSTQVFLDAAPNTNLHIAYRTISTINSPHSIMLVISNLTIHIYFSYLNLKCDKNSTVYCLRSHSIMSTYCHLTKVQNIFLSVTDVSHRPQSTALLAVHIGFGDCSILHSTMKCCTTYVQHFGKRMQQTV